MSRYEYDGSEGWEVNEIPKKKELPIKKIVKKETRAMWNHMEYWLEGEIDAR